MAKECYRVWDMMIEQGLQTHCVVTTNGTQWNSKVERILEALPMFPNISVDGATKETVESIRVNADFDTVRANVQKFVDYTVRKGTRMSLTYCLMRQNWHEFGAYLEYADSLGVECFINTVVDPPNCSLYTLPPDELSKIVMEMEAMDKKHQFRKLRINGDVWTSGLQALAKNASDRQRDGISEFRERHVDSLQKGWRHANEGDLDAALREGRKIPETHGTYYEGLMLQAHVLRRQGNLDEALQLLEGAIDRYPKAPGAFVERSWLRLERGAAEDALADAERAYELLATATTNEKLPHVLQVLASAQKDAGRPAEALETVDQALELTPENAGLYVTRGWCLIACERPQEAVAAADRALEIDPEDQWAPQLKEAAVSLS